MWEILREIDGAGRPPDLLLREACFAVQRVTWNIPVCPFVYNAMIMNKKMIQQSFYKNSKLLILNPMKQSSAQVLGK